MPKDDATWLNVSYVLFGVLFYYVLTLAFGTVGVQSGWSERYEWYQWTSTGGSLVVALIGTWGLRSNKERHEYLISAIAELRKVIWPTMDDTKKMTTIVVSVVAIFCGILTFFDMIWARILRWMLT